VTSSPSETTSPVDYDIRPLTDDELITYLEHQNRQAVGYMSDQVAADQDYNLDRYLGKPYGDEEEGSSNAISMDVAEVVDWALPDMLEPFISGDKVVEYLPESERDEAWVDQATDYANHIFFKDNDGVTFLYDAVKTGLIQKIGVAKTIWEDDVKIERQRFEGLSIINIQELQQDSSVEILSLQAAPIAPELLSPDIQAAFSDGKTYSVEIERQKKNGKVTICSVPPEQFKVTQRSSDLNSAEYICHEHEVRRYELLDMGFEQDAVMGLKDSTNRDTYRQDRRFYDEQRKEYTETNPLTDLLTLYEEYYRIDANGDGRAELIQAFRVGKTLLQKQEIDAHPFDAWSPDRIPNRLIGLALADKVKQTQKIKTHLTRQMLDNVYLSNNPRVEIPSDATGENTIEDLLTYRIGGLIRTKGQGGQMRAIEVPDRSKTALDAILYLDSVREQQSGITKNGTAINSEVLDPKSAYQSRKEDRNEQVRKRLMVRMLAETFLVPIFRKILANVVRYQDFERIIKLRGKWVPMDPRAWNADLAATASVGLGYANREEEIQAAQLVLAIQQQAMPIGLAEPKHMFKTGEKLIKAVGWRFGDEYFTDPSTPEGQQAIQAAQSRPDPKMAAVQAKAQADQAKLQASMQQDQQELQLKAQLAQLENQLETQKHMLEQRFEMEKHFAEQQQQNAFDAQSAARDYQAQIVKINLDHQKDLTKLMSDAQMARNKILAEMQIAREEIASNEQIQKHKNSVMAKSKPNGSSVRMGGKVG
jgi:hypothetical protein